MERIECVVVGAGVVGLAVARRFAMAGLEVLVLEQHGSIGEETSSRNSEVIHAGIYYPKGSRKARYCVEGNHRLYDYCASHGIEHRRCGKLIVAVSEAQDGMLEDIRARAAANGVDDLVPLSSAQVTALEPEVAATAALMSPSTGIIDSHGLMLAYQGDAEDHGAFIVFNSPLMAAHLDDRGLVIETGGAEPLRLMTDMLINCGGLHAPALARLIDGLDSRLVPDDYLCKGNYYALNGGRPFGRLIYPVPDQASLGIHASIDFAGQVRFGPDVEWIDEIDYDVDPRRADSFYDAIRRYWPALTDGALAPGYSGIRPKLVPQGLPAADFMLQGPAEHGVPGLVNLFGIESPGLTSSLAIADEVTGLLGIEAA